MADDSGDRSDPVVTDDEREARRIITDVYIPHDLRTRDGGRLDFHLRHLTSERLTVGHLTYGADSELIVPPMEDCYHVNLTLHGETMVSQRGVTASTAGGTSGVAIGPDDPFTVRWSPEAVQYAVKFPRAPLERQLSRHLGRDVTRPIRFDLGIDLATPAGQNLLAAVTFLREQLGREGGLGVRALQAAFRDQVGCSPAAHVRAVRLDRAHRDLVTDAGRTPITVVAARWGFLHPSRFAAQYRARFGVTPSRTVELALGGGEVTTISGAGRSSS